MGLLTGWIFMVLLIERKLDINKYKKLLLYLLTVLLICSAVLACYKRAQLKNQSIPTRIMLYKTASQIIKGKPIFGYGPGNFVVGTYTYFNKIKNNNTVYKLTNNARYGDKVHNEYLEILVEQGIIGLIVFLAFLYLLFQKSFSSRDVFLLGAFPGMLAVLIESLVSFPLRTPVTGAMFFILTGLIVPEGRKINFHMPRIFKIILFFPFLISIVWLIKPVIADFYFYKGKMYESSNLLEKAESYYPLSQKLYITMAKYYIKDGSYDKALEALHKAEKIQPFNEVIYFFKAQIYENTNKEQQAIKEYEHSISINPEFSPAYSGISELYIRLGDTEKALNTLKSSLEYNDRNAGIFNSLGIAYAYWRGISNKQFRVSKLL